MKLDDELAKIAGHIRGLVEEELKDETPYLLSKLGQDLGDALAKLKARNITLTRFLSEVFRDDYVIVTVGKFNNVQALVKKEKVFNIDESTPLAVTSPLPAPSSRKVSTRFNYRFWAAFSVPYTNHLRYLNLGDFTFVDEDECPSGDYLLIEKDFVAPVDAEKRDEIILANVKAWLEKNGLDEARFYAQRKEAAFQHFNERSVLDVLLQSLDHRQLARVALPLDIVDVLRKKRV